MKENNVKFLDQTKEELTQIYSDICEMFDLGFDAFTTVKQKILRRFQTFIRKQEAYVNHPK